MFKGIKKRFNSSRSGRGRKSERSPPPGDVPSLDTPDRKSASPRQVHPADLVVSAAPYARRSLERGGGRLSPCKSPSSSSTTTTTSSPTTNTTTTTTITTSAYPTAPNLCVTGGKIEFITPPDSTLSSTASRCSTLKLSPSTHREDVCPRSAVPAPAPGHAPDHGDHGTPPSSLSRSSGSSTGSKEHCLKIYSVEADDNEEGQPVRNTLVEAASPRRNKHHKQQELEDSSHARSRHQKNNGGVMDSGQKGSDGHQVEELRQENEEVKQRLSNLQHEFILLEEQVQVLVAERRIVEEQQRAEKEAQEQAYTTKLQQYQATIAALDQCTGIQPEGPPIPQSKDEECHPQQEAFISNDSVVQMLADRCQTLEQANKRLQNEARAQQRQYEVCLDRVATQVVQALLSQKSHQEQCIKLAHQVQDLRRQNAALSSLVGPTGMRQTLPCSHRHRCPPAAPPTNFFSLPTTLRRNRQQSEAWPQEGWVASWHVEESSRSHLGDHNSSQGHFHSSLQMLSDASIPTSLNLTDHNTTTSSSVRLGEDCYTPQERLASTTTTVTTANSTTTTCWYDIITSLSAANSPQGTAVASNLDTVLNPRLSDGVSVWSQSDQVMCEAGSASTSSSSSSDSPVQSSYHSHTVIFSRETGDSSPPNGCERLEETRGCVTPPPATSKFSPLSLESTVTCDSNSPEQKNCQVFQAKIDNLAFDKSKITVVHEEELLSNSPNEKNANLVVNNVNTDEICSILQVKEKLMKSLTESTTNEFTIDLSVLSCEEKNKGVLNKNLTKVGTKNTGNETSPGEEGTTKDEGYSTMSSDVQADVKDSITTCTVTTVQEEPLLAPTPVDFSDQGSTNTVRENLSRKGSNKSDNNSLEKTLVKERKISSAGNSEYCDGLRVIYDEEDNNSDVFFIPIQEPENESLYRHSYHIPSSVERNKPVRCYSDSQLYLERRSARNPKPRTSLERHVSEKDLAERSPSTEEVLEEANKNRSLKRVSGQASLKRSRMYAKEEHTTSHSSEELWPLEDNQRKYLSPTYSHAELEDWSLDLSSEYLSGVCGEGEGSESVGTSGAHHGSLPSIQEATPELEEDNNEFLWNGATYFKADLDLNWSSKKELTKSWQLDHSKENHIVLSPRSGCSDQPAVWSSSEQLSCCSEGVSKCSSDFENFCEQICNLPELKRVSFCSSEAGGQEASKAASQETSSVGEHEDELADDVCVDTVFTRDFYRLVKFESNKSLAASSKSLATSDGLLTIEKLQDLESGGTHKEALASVLGFIAEQQKYCEEREAQDEKVTSQSRDVLRLANTLDSSGSPLASVVFRGTFPKISPREGSSDACNSADDFSMRTLPSLQWKPSKRDSFKTKVPPPVPAKPKCSLHQDPSRGAPSSSNCIPARCPATTTTLPSLPVVPPTTLPVLPTTTPSVPFVPSRSSSLAPHQVIPACEVEVPLSHVLKVPIRSASHLPGTNSVTEQQTSSTVSDGPCQHLPVPDQCSSVATPPAVGGPPVPRRSSSMAFTSNVLPVPEHKVSLTDSPPVPKRITSRALPKPPASQPSSLLIKHNSNGCNKPLGGSLEGKRRSFIKETLGLSSPRRPQSDYCELPSLSENPSGMLEELQRMAKVEEEEDKKRRLRPEGNSGQEATSPGDTVGLGTGWVRVQPHIDLQDPQARANLLDGMMESSEGCSSETEEDEVAGHHYSQLRSMHRSRRKRKASHRSGNGRIIIGGGAPRPTVIGRKDLFVRFGEQERAALQEFEFLCDFSTSHSDLGSQDLCVSSSGATNMVTTVSTSVPPPSCISALPHSTRITGAVLPKVESNLLKKHISNIEEKNRTVKSDISGYNRSGQSRTDEQEGVDTRSIGSVKSAIWQLNKVNHISGIKQPATMPTIPARSASSISSTRANHLKSSFPISTNKPRAWTHFKSRVSDGNIGGASKCSVRRGNSPSSRTPSPQLSVKDNKGISSKFPGASHGSVERPQGSNSKTGSPTRIPRIQTPLMSSKKSTAESPKSQKEDSSPKDSCYESTKKVKSQCEKALPPKGFSSRAVKPSRIRSTIQLRQQQPNLQQQTNRSGIKSPRLTRLKKAADPLDSFNGKSLCDSGSSEGSERCGGRLSLSDSCAENFSPIDSGDEVFDKEY
ncbi:serine-rich adhesin for platelets-like isoform X2 [Homarus americanus]|uniref:serine-rich adhesin for platelets-like isoform X2 n=1 Tax=Homarus americanus TaxID=6706 RepID=UPI001C461F47|nr:serine-rich adhesin for platelets-like isoform X2 [Homarus americanus]